MKPIYAPSKHGKTGEPRLTLKQLRLKAEAIQELRGTISSYMEKHGEVLEPLLSMMATHDKMVTEVRQTSKQLHTADFGEGSIKLGDFKFDKQKIIESWDIDSIYAKGDAGVFLEPGVVTGVSGDKLVSLVSNKKFPSRILKYRKRENHPDYRTTGPSNITPKI